MGKTGYNRIGEYLKNISGAGRSSSGAHTQILQVFEEGLAIYSTTKYNVKIPFRGIGCQNFGGFFVTRSLQTSKRNKLSLVPFLSCDAIRYAGASPTIHRIISFLTRMEGVNPDG